MSTLVAQGEYTAEEAQKQVDKFAELEFQGTSPSNSFLCNNTWCSHWETCPHVEAIRKLDEFEEVEMFGAKL
jgi:hypothetical protein